MCTHDITLSDDAGLSMLVVNRRFGKFVEKFRRFICGVRPWVGAPLLYEVADDGRSDLVSCESAP